MKTNFKHTNKIRVRYGETDQMGYCYYGNYAQFFEVGRVESLRSLGMNYKDLEAKGIMLPVSNFEVQYKSPAYYDDELTIITTITEITGVKIIFTYQLSNEKGLIVAVASTTLVFVSKTTKKPTQAPEEFLSLIRPFEQTS